MLIWRKGKRKLGKYLLTPFKKLLPRALVMRVPGAGEQSVLWRERVMASRWPPLPSFSFGMARESCLAVGTNCNSLRKVFISATTHGYQMCRKPGRAGVRHPVEGEKQVASFSTLIICLLSPSALCSELRAQGRWSPLPVSGNWMEFFVRFKKSQFGVTVHVSGMFHFLHRRHWKRPVLSKQLIFF